jgi:YtcA family
MTNDVPGVRLPPFVPALHSPTLDLFGSYFPSWMLCAAAGIVAAVVIRQVLAIIGLGEYVVAPLLTYAGFALSATWLIWLWSGG